MCACVCKTRSEGMFATLHVLQGGPMTSLKIMRYYGERNCKDNGPIMSNMTKYVSLISQKLLKNFML